MRVMFKDPIWYPSNLVVLVGMVLTAVALAALVRGRGLTGWPRVHTAAAVAAISAGVGAAAMVLHLLAAVDADRIAEHLTHRSPTSRWSWRRSPRHSSASRWPPWLLSAPQLAPSATGSRP
jgi:hypothetical protein